ncbi:SLC13 family permease [Fructobacillus papyrifericola]|uniref:Citrate transporter-like domain-containing protein n=1 Tax=Fructobacillus papyrifericola TaxID=2713172 RepID=A0ABS5QS94_9LACO|nr:SLC13 family permease [Fructobacillus papyrifericola]MBS9336068.1 hypothetical protein [Fructobacillus papyrifericola]
MHRILEKLQHDLLFLFTTGLFILFALFGRVNWASISWPTVESLLALLGLVTLFQSLGLIDALADFFIEQAKTTRALVCALYLLTFFSAMVVTNDVAILTFVPLTFALAKKVSLPVVKVAAMVTVYANLGSAISPLGNPQNIFLLAHYQGGLAEMLLPALLLFLLALCSLPFALKVIAKTEIEPIEQKTRIPSFTRFERLLLTFASLVVLLSLLSQTNLPGAVVIVFLLILQFNAGSIKEIDYGVVFSILNFFLLVSVLISLSPVHQFLLHIGADKLSLFFSASLSSQVISNVPAAALLAPVTKHFTALYLGVSVGGFGTLVASLANLLAFRQVKANAEARLRRDFLLVFTRYNLLFLFLGVALATLYLSFT